MLHPSFYLVRATENLERLNYPDNDLRNFAIAERAWRSDHGGGGNLTPESYDCIVKVVVLAYFLSFKDWALPLNL